MNIDLFPTLASLVTDATLPDDRVIYGRNIVSLHHGAGQSPHESLYILDDEHIAAVRTPRWKLVFQTYFKQSLRDFSREKDTYYSGLRFGLDADPEELYSVAREHPEILEKRVALWRQGSEELTEPYVDRRDLPLDSAR